MYLSDKNSKYYNFKTNKKEKTDQNNRIKQLKDIDKSLLLNKIRISKMLLSHCKL